MIRALSDDDIDPLVVIWRQASRVSHPFIPDNYWHDLAPEMREVRIPCSETDVYEVQGTAVAFVSLLDHELMSLFVHPAHQGRGIGKELLDFAKSKRSALFLNVFAKNERAVSFYTAAGFAVVDETLESSTNETLTRMQWHEKGRLHGLEYEQETLYRGRRS